MFADLHLHTTASDGMISPSQMVKLAELKGFSAIAITDHDTTKGIDKAIDEGKKIGLEVIPGLELSTIEGDREIHILGYYPDTRSKSLQGKLQKIIESRNERALKMIKLLNELGYDLPVKMILDIAGSDFIGRPHIAQALVNKGYINEISEAFTGKFIGRNGAAYVERYIISPSAGINLLLQASAVPVLAHPGFLSKGEPVTEAEIISLIDMGLKGIEVYYSKHSPKQIEYYKGLAHKYSMLITGGSDFHNNNDRLNFLGSVKLPYKYVVALKNSARSK